MRVFSYEATFQVNFQKWLFFPRLIKIQIILPTANNIKSPFTYLAISANDYPQVLANKSVIRSVNAFFLVF